MWGFAVSLVLMMAMFHIIKAHSTSRPGLLVADHFEAKNISRRQAVYQEETNRVYNDDGSESYDFRSGRYDGRYGSGSSEKGYGGFDEEYSYDGSGEGYSLLNSVGIYGPGSFSVTYTPSSFGEEHNPSGSGREYDPNGSVRGYESGVFDEGYDLGSPGHGTRHGHSSSMDSGNGYENSFKETAGFHNEIGPSYVDISKGSFGNGEFKNGRNKIQKFESIGERLRFGDFEQEYGSSTEGYGLNVDGDSEEEYSSIGSGEGYGFSGFDKGYGPDSPGGEYSLNGSKKRHYHSDSSGRRGSSNSGHGYDPSSSGRGYSYGALDGRYGPTSFSKEHVPSMFREKYRSSDSEKENGLGILGGGYESDSGGYGFGSFDEGHSPDNSGGRYESASFKDGYGSSSFESGFGPTWFDKGLNTSNGGIFTPISLGGGFGFNSLESGFQYNGFGGGFGQSGSGGRFRPISFNRVFPGGQHSGFRNSLRANSTGRRLAVLFALIAPLAILSILGPIVTSQLSIPVSLLLTNSGGRRRRSLSPRFPFSDEKVSMKIKHRLEMLKVLQLYLAEKEDIQRYGNDIIANYLFCSGLLSNNNHCLERLVCELSDSSKKMTLLQKEVVSIVLLSILTNKKIPDTKNTRLREAAVHGEKNDGSCVTYFCDKVDKHKTKY
ncbi:uncharacterized protein LOC143235434 [Tachypleus tridentatus]|uniref:uncharacterized protein LOC143235434 n=1 Tax=Tachypleus tridentatus TaxID=6853 RepID=UPI003FCF9DD3